MATPPPPTAAELTENRGPQIIGAYVVLAFFTTAAVALRFGARHVARAKFLADDWLTLFAQVVFLGHCVDSMYEGAQGAGKHVAAVMKDDPAYIAEFLKYIYGTQMLYAIIIGTVKCSIIMLYVRLFGVRKKFKIWCYSLLGLTIIWALGLLFGSAFQCDPPSDAYNPLNPTRSTCVDLRAFLVGFNVPNSIIDFLILVTPFYPVWQLHMPLKKKILITLILMLGAGEVAFSIIRLVVITSLDTTDVTWNYFPGLVWSATEMAVGIFCSCLPVLGPLLPKKLIGSTDQGGSYSSSSGISKSSGFHRNRTNFDQLEDGIALTPASQHKYLSQIHHTTEITQSSTQQR